MAVKLKDALKMAFASSGYIKTITSLENFIFLNDLPRREQITKLKNPEGALDRDVSIDKIVEIMQEKISCGEAREENMAQAIFMIANANHKKKKRG